MHDFLDNLLDGATLPLMARVEQHFPDDEILDVRATVRENMLHHPAIQAFRPGMRVALAVGSRGIDRLPQLVAGMVEALHARDTKPFIVPAMGSHGGASSAGQLAMLTELGVTESTAGCPICSGMESVDVGALDDGSPVRMDALAQAADGIVVFNRVKPHNAFHATHESGLVKMLAIGLGNQSGADVCHRRGFGHMGRLILEMAKIKLAASPVLMGVGVVENAYDRVAHIFVCAANELMDSDARYLELARGRMPALPCMDLDLLIVDNIGKEFSGGGMDSNITGRHPTPFISGGPRVGALVVLDLTEKSRGNANGVGLADVTTERLFRKADRKSMYANALTSRVTTSARMPMVMPDAKRAILAGSKVCCAEDAQHLCALRIANTLHIGRFYASAALLPELQRKAGVSVLDAPRPMEFDAAGDPVQGWW